MRQSFLMLPRDVEEAARLDGAGEWTLFWRVMLPLARPAVITLALLAFMDQWRNFLWPLIVTRSVDMAVAEVALAQFHTTYSGNWPYQMAAAGLVTLRSEEHTAELQSRLPLVCRLLVGKKKRGVGVC